MKASLKSLISHSTNGKPKALQIDIAGLTPSEAKYILNCTKILMLEIKQHGSSAQATQQN